MQYEIYKDTPQAYRQLNEIIFAESDTFVFALLSLKEMGRSKRLNRTVDSLLPFIQEIKQENGTPGSQFDSTRTAENYYCDCSREALKIINEASGSLFEWCQPELPEDLSFMKNGHFWFINYGHEQYCTLSHPDQKVNEKILKIKGLEYRKIED